MFYSAMCVFYNRVFRKTLKMKLNLRLATIFRAAVRLWVAVWFAALFPFSSPPSSVPWSFARFAGARPRFSASREPFSPRGVWSFR